MKSIYVIAEAEVNFLQDTSKNETPESMQRIGGYGYLLAKTFANLKIPFTWTSGIGTGVYGEAVLNQFKKDDLNVLGTSLKTAGCSYTVLDENLDIMTMSIDGGQNDFSKEWIDRDALDKSSWLVLSDHLLRKETSKELFELLDVYDGHIYFKPTKNLDDENLELYKEVFDYLPLVHLSDSMLYAFVNQEDAFLAMEEFYETYGCKLVVSLHDGGCLYYDGIEPQVVIDEFSNINDRSGVDEIHAASYLAATIAGMIPVKAMQYANSCADKICASHDLVFDTKASEVVKQTFIDAILEH